MKCSLGIANLLEELSRRKANTNLDSILKSTDITLLTKVHLVKAMVFPVVIWMWELDHKESWVLKNWCFWTVMLEKTIESPLDSKPVNPKGNQSWIFTGKTDAEAETPILWSPTAKNWLTGKDPDAGKDWSQKMGTTEDEMVGWHHRLNGHDWVGASSGSWWWTGKTGVLESMGSQRIGHDWVTELTDVFLLKEQCSYLGFSVF